MIKKSTREIKKELKAVNVTYNSKTKKVTRDAYDQKDYNNTLKLLKRLENKYNVDLSQYREKLIYQNREFTKAIREFNKAEIKDTFDLQFTDRQLQATIRDIQDLNPMNRSDSTEYIKKLFTTQKSNSELAEELTRKMSDEIGLSEEEINKYLYPTGEEEKSYYEKLMEYIENGYSYEISKSKTDEWYSTPHLNNIDDVIQNYVPEKEQKRVREMRKFYQRLMLTNLGGYKNL